MKLKAFRNVTVFLAIAAMLLSFFSIWFDISTEVWNDITALVVAVLTSVGFFTATNDATPLTWSFVFDKMKSRLFMGGMLALVVYIVSLFNPALASVLTDQGQQAIGLLVLMGVLNNGNSEDSYIPDVLPLQSKSTEEAA